MASMPAGKAKAVQEMLNKLVKPKPPLKVDGVLGPQSTAAIKLFQQKAGLKQSGEIDAETAPAVARAIQTGKVEKDQPEVYVKLPDGKYAGMTQREFDNAKKKVIQQLLNGPVREAKMKSQEALSTWESFNDLNKDQYVVSFLIEKTRGAKLPPKSLIDKAVKAADDIEKLARAGDNDGFLRRARSCAAEVNAALDAMRSYRDNMIDGAGNWVTGLETTKWASFTVLSIYAAPVAAASLGTGALASAVVGGAAVKALESSAGELGNWTAGNIQGGKGVGGAISRVALDTLVGAVCGWLSKGGGGGNSIAEVVVEKITKGVGGKLVAAGLSQKAVDFVVKNMVTEGAKKILEGAVEDAAKALKNDPEMTWSKFGENVAQNFMKGVALGPLVKWIADWKALKGNPFDATTTNKVKAAVEKEVLKNGSMYIDEFRKQSDKMMAKYMEDAIEDTVGKNIDKILEVVMKGASDVFDTKKMDKEVSEQVATPAAIKQISTDMSKKIIDDLKKSKKK